MRVMKCTQQYGAYKNGLVRFRTGPVRQIQFPFCLSFVMVGRLVGRLVVDAAIRAATLGRMACKADTVSTLLVLCHVNS